MKMKNFQMFAGLMAASIVLSAASPAAVFADELVCEWREENGNLFWYENGVKQGTEGRGKEIYDPASDGWYWLDAVDGGKKAVSKDVYQESESGIWGDELNAEGKTIGKWVRYDAEGRMVKGWDGDYYFDPVYGTMAKGYATIDGKEYYFNSATGVKEQELGEVPVTGWKEIDGNFYWYEDGIRQGYSVREGYRGKEIFDPESNAWYWLDSVDDGKKAVSKDVYQESQADDEGNIGKWVRYDADGHMVKGWDGDYYFDPVYGTMAKGNKEIDGVTYYFNEDTGVCEGKVGTSESESESESEYKYVWRTADYTKYSVDDKALSREVYEYDDAGNQTRYATYGGNKLRKAGDDDYNESYSDNAESMILSLENIWAYNEAGEQISSIDRVYSYVVNEEQTERKSYLWSESAYTLSGGEITSALGKVFDENGKLTAESVTEYQNGKILVDKVSYDDGNGMVLRYIDTYEYDANGFLVKRIFDNAESSEGDSTYVYENNSDGNPVKWTYYNSKNEAVRESVYEYSGENRTVEQTKNLTNNKIESRYEYAYDASGNMIEQRYYYPDYRSGELKLSSRYKYTYDAYGNKTGSEHYDVSFDYEGKMKETLITFTIKTYVENDTDSSGFAEKSYDSYSGFIVQLADGTLSARYYDSVSEGETILGKAYSMGYSYDYDETTGMLIKENEYISNTKYEKELSAYTEYYIDNSGKANEAGAEKSYISEKTFDADGTQTGYGMSTLKTIKIKL